MNILPLPALDGGRIAFVFIEWIRKGKKISPRVEGMVHFAGFILLIGLMLIVTYQDIVRIITQGGALP
jgi:regulator of sigma E protease